MLGNKLLNIQFAKYHIWNNKSKGFPNMVLSTETFNQSVRTEYSEAVNVRYTFQPLWVSDLTQSLLSCLRMSPVDKENCVVLDRVKSVKCHSLVNNNCYHYLCRENLGVNDALMELFILAYACKTSCARRIIGRQ